MEANSMSRLAVGFLNWAFRSESGGLLNVLFTPSPNTTSTFDLASNEQTIFARLKSLFLGCIWHRGKALLVLKAIPVELGGGASGVDKYHQDPNRSNAMFWSPLGYLLLSLLLTVGMSWKISGRRCKRTSRKVDAEERPTENTNRMSQTRLKYLELTCLTVSLMLMFVTISLIVLYIVGSNTILGFLGTEDDSESSIIMVAKNFTTSLKHFTKDGFSSGKTTISAAVKDLETELANSFKKNGKLLIETAARHFQLNEMNALKDEMSSQFIDKFSSIRTIDDDIIADMHEVSGYAANLKEKQQVLGDVLEIACLTLEQCGDLINSVATTQTNFNTSIIHPDILKTAFSKLNSLKQGINPWFSLIDALNQALEKAQREMPPDVDETVDFSAPMEKAWNHAELQAHRLLHFTDKAVSQIINIVSGRSYRLASVIISTLGGAFAILLLFGITLHIGFCWSLGRRLLLKDERFNRKPSSPYQASVAGLSVIVCIFLVIAIVFVMAATFTSSVLYTEACVYLQGERIGMTDFVLTGYLQGVWPTLGFTSDILLNGIKPPTHPIHVIAHGCSKAYPGLITQMGWTNVVDLPTLFHTDHVQKLIQNGRETLTKHLNTSWILPSTEELETLETVVTGIVEIEGQTSKILKEFKPNKINISKLEKISILLEFLESTLQSIKEASKKFNEIQSDAGVMRDKLDKIEAAVISYEGIEGIHTHAARFFQWLRFIANGLSSEEKLNELVTEIYRDITWRFIRKFEPAISSKIGQLFPCQSINTAYGAVMNVTCGDHGFLPSVFGWGITVWMLLGALTFFGTSIAVASFLHNYNCI